MRIHWRAVRLLAIVLGLVCSLLAACAQPAYVSCESPLTECPLGCTNLAIDPFDCGACGHACAAGEMCTDGQCVGEIPAGVCAVDNGGCSADAFCMDIGGAAACACHPGFTGSGVTCDACSVCAPEFFATAPCTPVDDTVCTACSAPCSEGRFESAPCGGPQGDRVCTMCTFCVGATYTVSPCSTASDSVCAPCETGCLSCSGPGPTCFVCDTGFVLNNGACMPTVCGNGVLEPGEQCDDGDLDAGDGCDGGCMIEAGNYCFGEVLSMCRAGGCVADPATAALGPDFELDGLGAPTASGTQLTVRSMIRTTAPVTYPVVVEATVVYSGFDVTYIGTRGNGLRDGNAADEPTDNLRARLSVTDVELATGPGTTVIANTTPPFAPTPGVPYRIRFVDDGLFASVEWFNPNNLSEGVALQQMTSYHGSDDRAFVGGGDQGAVTVSDIRVCSAPPLPVTAGLAAHYSAIPSWTVTRDMANVVSSWSDMDGIGPILSAGATSPAFGPGQINAQKPAVDFGGGAGLVSTAFPLTTNVSVFVVMDQRVPAMWGAIAHHGNRDTDWSMEQNGSGDPNTLHWQTNNDNANMDLTLTANKSYVLTGIFNGLTRYFSATTFDGTTITPVSITDASHSIVMSETPMWLGTSDNGEASNAAIGELVYFNRALTDTERDAVIAYLQALWRPQ